MFTEHLLVTSCSLGEEIVKERLKTSTWRPFRVHTNRKENKRKRKNDQPVFLKDPSIDWYFNKGRD